MGDAPDIPSQARAIVEHEDQLINHRLSWMMAFNGFLFAALGLTFSAEATSLFREISFLEQSMDVLLSEEQKSVAQSRLQQFYESIFNLRTAIFAAGLLSSVAALVGVVAANAAIRCARIDLRKASPSNGRAFRLMGPGSTSIWGTSSSISFPCILAGTWLGWGCSVFAVPPSECFAIGAFLALLLFALSWAQIARTASSYQIDATRTNGVDDVQ